MCTLGDDALRRRATVKLEITFLFSTPFFPPNTHSIAQSHIHTLNRSLSLSLYEKNMVFYSYNVYLHHICLCMKTPYTYIYIRLSIRPSSMYRWINIDIWTTVPKSLTQSENNNHHSKKDIVWLKDAIPKKSNEGERARGWHMGLDKCHTTLLNLGCIDGCNDCG